MLDNLGRDFLLFSYHFDCSFNTTLCPVTTTLLLVR
jgi:hypothetical protein